MESEYRHKILVVDDDKKNKKPLEAVFKTKKIDYVFVNRGEAALDEIKKADKPFSVIIADQGLESMTGTSVLEHAKRIKPDTVRVLMTSHSQVETIINAVNRGAIQNFIVKPWSEDNLEKAINSAIKLYNKFLKNRNVVRVAKKQNKILYKLSRELMETTKNHDKSLCKLDKNIETLKSEIKAASAHSSDNPDIITNNIIDEIHSNVKTDTGIDTDKIQTLFNNTIKNLYDEFNDIAYRNGFEMPDIKGEIK